MEFKGTAAVVTGGGSGIGSGIALALAAAGANVVVADVEQDAAEAMAERVRALGVDSIAVRTDVTSLEQVQELATTARRRFGDVHLLFNNAGVSVLRRGVDATHADWTWLINVNLWGVVHGMEAFLPSMLASGAPCHIVNTASMNGLFPSARSPMYSATKYAVVGLTETFRNELSATDVAVSVLCPAAVTSRIDDAERNRPADLRADIPAPPFTASMRYEISAPRDPESAGALVLDGIRNKQLFIFTDDSVRPYIEERHQRILADLDRLRY
jgi:NAD(P)-dependent dehydrogenase (short-subunit alcohol dehydrogenase family)